MQAGLSLGVEAGNPPVGALAGDAHRLGDMRDRHLLVADPLDEQKAAMECEAGVTVTHEDLREGEDGYLHCTGGLRLRQRPVTNVLAEYI